MCVQKCSYFEQKLFQVGFKPMSPVWTAAVQPLTLKHKYYVKYVYIKSMETIYIDD